MYKTEYLVDEIELVENVIRKFDKENWMNVRKTLLSRQYIDKPESYDAINGMLNRIKKEMEGKINNIILTGGFSKILSKHIEHKHTLAPNMSLDGIKLIWEENQ